MAKILAITVLLVFCLGIAEMSFNAMFVLNCTGVNNTANKVMYNITMKKDGKQFYFFNVNETDPKKQGIIIKNI